MPTTEKEQRLKQVLELLDGSITKKDFTEAFSLISKLVTKLKANNEAEFRLIQENFRLLSEKLKKDNSGSLADLKRSLVSILRKLNAKVDAKLASVKDGERGEQGPPGPAGKSGKDGSPDTSEQVRDKLEALKGNERLDKGAIKGLEELFKKREGPTYTVFGGGSRMSVKVVDVSSQCNGVLKTFSIPTNYGVVGVFSTQFPQVYRPTIDYTEGNKSITLTSEVGAPATGQTLIVQYIR